ncbi:MAG: DUF7144 family membrane protein [Solirubrobacterales bacterium]
MPRTRSGSRSGWVTLVGVLLALSGASNVIIGLLGIGIEISGQNIHNTTLGDWPAEDLEGIAIAMLVLGVVQLVIGAGVLIRAPIARIAGIVLASLVVLVDLAYYRLLDGWALTGILWNLAIVFILATKERDF